MLELIFPWLLKSKKTTITKIPNLNLRKITDSFDENIQIFTPRELENTDTDQIAATGDNLQIHGDNLQIHDE